MIALSDLVIEVWGLPYGRMFAQGSHRADARTAGSSKHESGKAGGRDTAGAADGSSEHGELPYNSTFLGAVTVSQAACLLMWLRFVPVCVLETVASTLSF